MTGPDDDLGRRLADLARAADRSGGVPAGLDRRVRRVRHRRQATVAASTALTVAAVAVGAVVLSRSVDTGPDRQSATPAAGMHATVMRSRPVTGRVPSTSPSAILEQAAGSCTGKDLSLAVSGSVASVSSTSLRVQLTTAKTGGCTISMVAPLALLDDQLAQISTQEPSTSSSTSLVRVTPTSPAVVLVTWQMSDCQSTDLDRIDLTLRGSTATVKTAPLNVCDQDPLTVGQVQTDTMP